MKAAPESPFASCASGLRLRLGLVGVLVALASTLQGCHSDVLDALGLSDMPKMDGMAALTPATWLKTHKVPFWRKKEDYWDKFSYKDPVSGRPAFNSCMDPRVIPQNVCQGHGHCQPYDEHSGLSFCKCEDGYGGSECQIKRLKQSVAFVLSMALGPIGADQFYLGNIVDMVLKQLTTLIGLTLLVILRYSKVPGLCFLILPWMRDVIIIGSAPAQGKEYRSDHDLPRFAFVVLSLVWVGFVALGICVADARHKAQIKRLNQEQANNYSNAKILA